jgi:DNA invertase Pin-like site-specific DNA recombinase
VINKNEIIESPILTLGNGKRGGVAYLGNLMYRATAVRMSEYRADFKKAADKGMCIREAAKYLGFHYLTVYKWAKIFKIKFKNKNKRVVYKHDRSGWHDIIIDGLNKGMTFDELDLKLGVGRNNTYNFCRKHKINAKQIKADAKANR